MGRPADDFSAFVGQWRLQHDDPRYPHFVANLLIESLYRFSTYSLAQQYDWYHQRGQRRPHPGISCLSLARLCMPISEILVSITSGFLRSQREDKLEGRGKRWTSVFSLVCS